MKVIFLDIDGVLVTRRSLGLPRIKYGGMSSSQFEVSAVWALNRLLEGTGACIVVSSTWRLWPSVAGYLAHQGVRGKVVGKTPDMQLPDRRVEINAWLYKQGEGVESFVILDDGEDAGLEGRLVLTTFEDGLTKELGDKAAAILARKWQGKPRAK